MGYRFLDDAPPADVGFVASGATPAACFEAAAEATLAVMLGNPEALQAKVRHTVRFERERLDVALLSLLEELVYYKDAEGQFLRARDVVDTAAKRGWAVQAVLVGEGIDRSRHRLAGDVKAVTMHRLAVEETADGWRATVVLDV